MRYLRLRLHERSHGREFLTEYGVWPQEIPPLLTRSGSDFETAVEAQVAGRFPTRNLAKEAPSRDRRPADNPIVVELARALPPGERLCLFQPRLVVELGDWAVRGEIDLLRMERDTAGALHLLIADMKSSATAKVEHRLQVAFYQAMLTRLFQDAGVEHAGIQPAILYRGPANEVVAQTEAEVTAIEAQREAAIEVFGVSDALLEMVPDPDAY